jgi:type VII secretion protein EccB
MTPRPISEGLLNAIPEVLPITPPKIVDPGGAPAKPIGTHRNGDVVQLSTDGQYYVVLHDGLQQISALTADIIRNSNPTAEGGKIEPYDRTNADIVNELPVADYPATAPTVVDVKDRPVDCLSWKPLASAAGKSDGTKRASLTLITGRALPIPDNAIPVRMVQADYKGVAQFYTTPGRGMLVQTTGIEPDSQRKDSVFYIADTGVRYGIKDAAAAKALGMDSDKAAPEPAPWPIAGLLPSGPTLGRQEAMVAHDGVAPDPDPAKALVKSKQDQQAQN